MKEKISIIMPVFNEEKGIAGVIRDIKNTLVSCNYEYEIIVVDDGSTDQSVKMALKEGAKVITNKRNKGYGASIMTGIKNSDGEFVAIIDGDGSYAAKDLLNLTRHIKENDMVVGARTKPGINEPFLRRIDKFFLKKLASYLIEMKIPDLNSGLRIMRRDRLSEFLRILPKGYSLTTTVTLLFLNSDFNVEFIPIDYKKRRGKSKIRPVHDTLIFMQLIIRTVIYFNPLKVFLPVSIFLFASAIFILFYSRFIMGRVMDITTIVLIVASLQLLATGMIADLIIRRTK